MAGSIYEEHLNDLIYELNVLPIFVPPPGREGDIEKRVETGMNIIVSKLEQIVVEENGERLVRVFEGDVRASIWEVEGLRTLKLPQESTAIIDEVLGDAGDLILHDRQGEPHPLRVIMGTDGRYRLSIPADGPEWITMLNRDGYQGGGGLQKWEIWLLKVRYAGHFRAVSVRPHFSRETRSPPPAAASEEEEEDEEEEDDPAVEEEEEEEEEEENNPPKETGEEGEEEDEEEEEEDEDEDQD